MLPKDDFVIDLKYRGKGTSYSLQGQFEIEGMFLELFLTFVVVVVFFFDCVGWNWFGENYRRLFVVNLGSEILPFKRSISLHLFVVGLMIFKLEQFPSASITGVSETPQEGVKLLHLNLIIFLVSVIATIPYISLLIISHSVLRGGIIKKCERVGGCCELCIVMPCQVF